MKRAILWGFGSLGRGLARAAVERGDMAIVAVVDRAPELAGVKLATILPGLDAGLVAAPDLAALAGLKADLVLHAATSEPAEVSSHLTAALQRGFDVVTAAEWMFHPWLRYADLAALIDAAAKAAARRVLGIGINPGFAFDALPLVLGRTVAGLRRIEATRIVDAGGIGASDFAHVGFGLSPEQFAERLGAGAIEGHIGFPESMAAVAERCGWPLDTIEQSWEPVLSKRDLVAAGGRVARGQVAGVVQRAVASFGAVPRLSFALHMLLDPDGSGAVSQESVVAVGHERRTFTLLPAASPVDGAASLMLHAAAALDQHPAGLLSPLDLPLGSRPRPAQGLRAMPESRRGLNSRLVVAAAGPAGR